MSENNNKDCHSFNVQMAKEIGLEETLLLKHLYYWCYANSDKEDMIKNGYIWVYITMKKIEDTYPYLSTGKIRGSIEKLKKNGYIISDCFNKLVIDKTKWYALTDKAYKEFGTSIAKLTNGMQNLQSVCKNNKAIQSIKKDYNNKEHTIVCKKENNAEACAIPCAEACAKDNVNPCAKSIADEWRHDYDAYKQLVCNAAETLKADVEFKEKQEMYFPNVNFELSIDKGCDYWLSEQGYRKCKAAKTKISMLARLKNNFDKNRIYYQQGFKPKADMINTQSKDTVVINGTEYK